MQTFPNYQCLQKGVWDFFILFRFRVTEARFFIFLLITQDLNEIKKNPEQAFVDIVRQEKCVKFQQKILNSMVVGARKSSHFFRQRTWFLENNRALSKFRSRILHYLKVQSCKLYNNKYIVALIQITNTEIFASIAAVIFKLLSRKVLFTNRKYNRNCSKVGYFLRK